MLGSSGGEGTRGGHTNKPGGEEGTRRTNHSPASQGAEAVQPCPFDHLTRFFHVRCLSLPPSSVQAMWGLRVVASKGDDVAVLVRPFRGSLRGLRPSRRRGSQPRTSLAPHHTNKLHSHTLHALSPSSIAPSLSHAAGSRPAAPPSSTPASTVVLEHQSAWPPPLPPPRRRRLCRGCWRRRSSWRSSVGCRATSGCPCDGKLA